MKTKRKLLYIAVTLTIASTALVVAAPKHNPAPHLQNKGGRGKTFSGGKAGGQKKLARAGRGRGGSNGFGGDASLTPTPSPTPTPEVSPSSSSGNPAT